MTQTSYTSEAVFWDDVARKKTVAAISTGRLEEFRKAKYPNLFPEHLIKRIMGDLKNKKILEIGCGNGVGSIFLAHLGALVHAYDISPLSIDNARQLAKIHNVDISFEVADVTAMKSFGENCYDIVWCDLCLHHMTNDLNSLMQKLKESLKPGGLFIAREPVAYPQWLKELRKQITRIVPYENSDDQQPLRKNEFDIVETHFPMLKRKYFKLCARIDLMHPPAFLFNLAAFIDFLLLMIPGMKVFAGNAVLWAEKPADRSF
jgi:2-polyprenyl-3-methyl-5-hydroxy-6-metoxy-1,4-benzoquinol methylase